MLCRLGRSEATLPVKVAMYDLDFFFFFSSLLFSDIMVGVLQVYMSYVAMFIAMFVYAIAGH